MSLMHSVNRLILGDKDDVENLTLGMHSLNQQRSIKVEAAQYNLCFFSLVCSFFCIPLLFFCFWFCFRFVQLALYALGTFFVTFQVILWILNFFYDSIKTMLNSFMNIDMFHFPFYIYQSMYLETLCWQILFVSI